MAKRKLIASVEKTNRQWAWQFLRRNSVYREAYALIGSLRDDQRDVFLKLINNQLSSYSENWESLGSLPVKFFDRSNLWNEKNENKTLDEYIRDLTKPFSKKKRNADQIVEEIDSLVLSVLPKFRTYQYGLLQWIDPDIKEITAQDAESIWFYHVPLEESLIRTPGFDDKGFSFEKSEWQGVSTSVFSDKKNAIDSAPVDEKEKRNQPVQHETLPLKKGVNGAVFMMNYFNSPVTVGSFDGQSTTTGLAPDPQSRQGDCLVRATFDLSLPIKYQLEAVKEALSSHQKALQAAGFVDELPSRKSREGVFASYVAILDLHEQGLSDLEIAKKLKGLKDEPYIDAQGVKRKSYNDPKNPDWSTSQEHTNGIRKQLERARHLRDEGYRSLALQSD